MKGLKRARKRLDAKLNDCFTTPSIELPDIPPVAALLPSPAGLSGISPSTGLPISMYQSPAAPLARSMEDRVAEAFEVLGRAISVPPAWLSMGGRMSLSFRKRGSIPPTLDLPRAVLNISGPGFLQGYFELLDQMVATVMGKTEPISGGKSIWKNVRAIAPDTIEGTVQSIFKVLYGPTGQETRFLRKLTTLPRSHQERADVFARALVVYVRDRMREKKLQSDFLLPVIDETYPPSELVTVAAPQIRKYFQEAFAELRRHDPPPPYRLNDDADEMELPAGSKSAASMRAAERSSREDSVPFPIDDSTPRPPEAEAQDIEEMVESLAPSVATPQIALQRSKISLKREAESVLANGGLMVWYHILYDGDRDGSLVAEIDNGHCVVKELVSWRGNDGFDRDDLRTMVEQLVAEHALASIKYAGEARSGEDALADDVVTLDQIAQMHVETLPLSMRYRRFLGKVTKRFNILLYGDAGGGKSSWVLPFAADLTRFGRVLYINAEEPVESGTLTLKAKLMRVSNQDIHFKHTDEISEIEQKLQTGQYRYCVIDSLNRVEAGNTNTSKKVIHELSRKFPDVSFIYIVHATKEGGFHGPNAWKHDVDIVITVENGVATTGDIKNRFSGERSRFPIFSRARRR